MWRKQIDSSFPEFLPKRVAVVRLVADHSFRTGPRPAWPFLGDFDLLECLFGEPDLCWRSRVGMASQRKTLAIDHHHELCALSSFGFSDSRAPFFAGKKLASINASSQSSTPLASNSERKARHISLKTSASYHSFRRRQHVEGCGYLSGRSFHLAPVLSNQRIASNTRRSSALGRPPFGRGGDFGIRGSILAHCSSVKYTTRSLTGLTSGELNRLSIGTLHCTMHYNTARNSTLSELCGTKQEQDNSHSLASMCSLFQTAALQKPQPVSGKSPVQTKMPASFA